MIARHELALRGACGRGWVTLLLGLVLLVASTPARGESIKDRVRTHVEDELEKPERTTKKPSTKKRSTKKRRSTRRPKKRGGGLRRGSARRSPPPSSAQAEPEPEEPKGPKFPQRVIGKYLRLDPKLGGGYRGWYLQPYNRVDVSAQSYFTWSVDVQAKLFKIINLRRGYYESNALSGPRRDEAVVAERVGKRAKQAAWLLATIGVPINRAWEPVIKYESRRFKMTARPNPDVRIVPHDTPADADLGAFPLTSQDLVLTSSFETFVAGVRYSHSKDSSAVITDKKQAFPPIFLGVGFLSYGKPYQVTVGDAVLDEILFDARFRGAGLAFGVDTKVRPDSFFVDFEGQVGLGEVRLLEDLTLNELLPQKTDRAGLEPPEWLIGYAMGNATVGYLLPLLRTKPTLLASFSASGGGATFFYFKTQAEEGETIDAPPLNWDLLWGVRASLILPL